MKKSRYLPSLLAAALTAALLVSGCAESSAAPGSNSAASSGTTAVTTAPAMTTKPQGEIYKNGVYEGIGYGKNGAIQVKIELQSDRLISLELVHHRDTPDYFQPVWDAIYAEMMGQDRPDLPSVDSVSGATASAQGILDAIQSALYKARR